jgi:tRNA-Thr(GGU) m(6)t(6)A37 methyltransferase TsaA
MDIGLRAIGFVSAPRPHAEDDFWGGEEASIRLTDEFSADALQGLSEFSHVEILFLFHEVDPSRVVTGARHPRNNPAWPATGIFAQRGKNRPNRLGSTICRVMRVDGSTLWVKELDAIDGTPVLDIKPVMIEFLPREPVLQPAWSHELMREYWSDKTPG